jgi:hypothetical protein
VLGGYLDFLDIHSDINLDIKNDIWWISLGVMFSLIAKVLDIIHRDIRYVDIQPRYQIFLLDIKVISNYLCFFKKIPDGITVMKIFRQFKTVLGTCFQRSF